MYPLRSLSSLKGDPDGRACLTHVADPINSRNVKGGGLQAPCLYPPTHPEKCEVAKSLYRVPTHPVSYTTP